MKNLNLKETYVSPEVLWTIIKLEESIAAGSITVEAGGLGDNPLIEEWEDSEEDKYKNFDL